VNVEISLTGPPSRIEALSRFLTRVQPLIPASVTQSKVIVGEDGVIYVKAGFASEEETLRAGEAAAEISAEIVEDTNVLVVLAPFVAPAA
jgi:hypothetical protein